MYPVLLASFGQVDFGLLAANALGLLLLGALYLSVGLFFSACTRHQIVAVLLSVTLLILLTLASFRLAETVSGTSRTVLQHVSIQTHFFDFVRGMVDLNHVVFFVTMTGGFLFLTVKILETRRWH